jgi:hypothetical protein
VVSILRASFQAKKRVCDELSGGENPRRCLVGSCLRGGGSNDHPRAQGSVSAFSETPFEKSEQSEIEPKLYNPLFEDMEGESPFISLAEPLAQQKRIYAVTSEGQRPFVIGLPRVVRANLFYCGLSEQEAWDLSNESAEDERIVRVDWFRSATQQKREFAQDILTSKLLATIVGPMSPVDQA